MATVLLIIGKLFGSLKIGGIAISEIIAWLGTPQGVAALGAAQKVLGGLVKNGDSLTTAGIKLLAMIGKVHQMTPAEEKIWMDRSSNTNTSG